MCNVKYITANALSEFRCYYELFRPQRAFCLEVDNLQSVTSVSNITDAIVRVQLYQIYYC